MTGVCGWLGRCDVDAGTLLDAMCGRITWTGAPARSRLVGDGFGLGVVGPRDATAIAQYGALKVAFYGHGGWRSEARSLAPADVCQRVADEYRRRGAEALTLLKGDFSLALLDLERNEALIAVDRMGVRNLVYRSENGVLVFAANLDALRAHPLVDRRVDAQAIYNYVYFHMVPGPATAFERTRRLGPGEYLHSRNGNGEPRRYWDARFVEDLRRDLSVLAGEFRALLRESVDASRGMQACGTFLSGGTDSSTVTGMLSELADAPVGTYSIGFDAAGYDEMDYARIAARRFHTDHHEYYVTPADVAAAIPELAAEYDQPFGNASAVPTYYCARFAKSQGVSRMLAGDGGDELFGGNARYAKQHLFALYERVPRALRAHVVEPLLRTRAARSLPLVRKAGSYVEQARLPMPARYETYNLLERLGPGQVFTPEFLATVDRGGPLRQLAVVHGASNADSLVNQMIAIDFKFTLADNDLPKVTRMCDRAGVDVAFPLLHDDVVAFSTALPPDYKLRGTRLRWFFKEALADFLPPEIIAKKKHGFGLPTGLWLANDETLRAMSGDALAGLRKRGIFREEFLDSLISKRLREHAVYYGTMVWILMMLELWFQHHVDVDP